MKNLSVLLIFNLVLLTVYSQDAISYDWELPKYDINSTDANEKGIILLDFRSIYFKKANIKNINLSSKRKTIHKRIFVNSDEAIEEFNKVYVPTRDVNSIERLKVRTINKEGIVTEFNPENLKVLDNVEGNGEFTIFAIEGIENGAIIEYLYDFEMDPNVYGSEIFQDDLPIRYAELYLYGKGLDFDIKGYNGVEVKMLKDGKKSNAYGGIMRDIPAFREEFYAANDANMIRIDYIAKGFDWQSLSQIIISNTYSSSDAKNKIEEILNQEIKINEYETKAEKINAIENYIKQNFQVIQDYTKDLSNVNTILDTKFSSVMGITFLFSAFFNEAKIDYELVASCDRFSRKFDRDFASPYNLDYLIFYFADQKKFLMPYPFDYKEGMVPDFLLTQEGFSVGSSFGDSKNLTSNFRFIDIEPKEDFETRVTENITVHLKKNETPFISVMIDLQGYRALEFITLYNQVPLDRRKEYATFYVPQSLENQVTPDRIMINGSSDFSEDITDNHATIYAELPADQFIEGAGSAIIFKLGDLIGKQMELYQEEERMQDIEMNYFVDYDRTITFNYDEGFTIEGQEDITINTNNMPVDLYPLMRFYSSYEDDGKQLVVSIDEYYKFIHMDKQYYPNFREVINAAANFNKVSLLITYSE